MDLSMEQNAYAIFAPAVQPDYAKLAIPRAIKTDRLPEGVKAQYLNFLRRPNPLFTIKAALASAATFDGQPPPTMLDRSVRAPDSLVIVDSGGFSLINNSGNLALTDETRWRFLRWQERWGDVGMTLDVPLKAIDMPQSGFTTFKECLNMTVQNLTFIVKYRDRSAPLRLLNVLQGRTPKEADQWYDAVKGFPFEGWAVGGVLKLDLHDVMRRILIMLEEGRLTSGTAWLHFLGVESPRMAVVLTALKQALRRILPTMEITFDAATPFTSFTRGAGQAVLGLRLDNERFNFQRHTLQDLSSLDPSTPLPLHSPLADRLTVGMVRGNDTGWGRKLDGVGMVMVKHHNVHATVMGLLLANRHVLHTDVNHAIVPYDVMAAVKAVHTVFEATDRKGELERQKATLRKLMPGGHGTSDDPNDADR